MPKFDRCRSYREGTGNAESQHMCAAAGDLVPCCKDVCCGCFEERSDQTDTTYFLERLIELRERFDEALNDMRTLKNDLDRSGTKYGQVAALLEMYFIGNVDQFVSESGQRYQNGNLHQLAGMLQELADEEVER